MAGYKALLDKSIASAISAIEIYNKPDFKYREETFTILMSNAWELLLKAKILKDNKNDLNSIYRKEKRRNKDGSLSKRLYIEKNRAGNPMTLKVYDAMNKLELPIPLRENLKVLIEIRDNAVHYLNEDHLFQKKVLEVGTASLQNYAKVFGDWFTYNLSQYNFYILPVSFVLSDEIKETSFYNRSSKIRNLLSYILEKERPHIYEEEYPVSRNIELKLSRVSNSDYADLKVIYDPDAKQRIGIDEEQRFKHKYPIGYKELVERMEKRYADFSRNKKFYKHKKKLEEEERYCGVRYLDMNKKSGPSKKYYSPEIFREFDTIYTKK